VSLEPLHVTNGDSAAHTLERTSLGGNALPWRDALHEGPLPFASRAAFLDARVAFLAETGWGSRTSLAGEFHARDDELLAALRAGRSVVLWFEHDLYDQLQLLDVLAFVHSAGAPHETLELVQVGSFPGRPAFRGLGELSSDELETLWPQRAPIAPSLLAEASAIWADVRADDPRALAKRAVSAIDGMPFLASALARFVEELPALRDGLSRTERQLLHVLAGGPQSSQRAYIASQGLEDAPFHGDTWVYRALWELGRGDVRLVESAAGGPVPPVAARDPESGAVELRLTSAGRRVLDGDADRVELLGIDRWVGGTHLVPGAVWRWDGEQRSVVAPG
jgi:Domain of unknown function (DUF1835)